MATVPLFKIKRANCGYAGKSGTVYKFQGTPHGKCWVTDKKQIEELLKAAEDGEAGIYIDPKESEIDTEAATPYDAMKRKIIQEYLVEQGKVKDAGDYDASLSAQVRSVAGTDENILTGSALAAKKNQAELTGTDSPALAALKATANAAAPKK